MPTVHIQSIGQIACMAETPVPDVQQILDDVGAEPALVINLIPHYTTEVCGTVIARAKGWTELLAYSRTFFDEIQADA